MHSCYIEHEGIMTLENMQMSKECWMDKTLRLMIVDDNPRARGALSAFISTQNWMTVVCEASNGEEAVEKIRSQIPDVILMDIQMPVMDGLKATQIIKKRWPQIKIIALTLYSNYQSQAKQAGADAFLIKGCSVEEMTSTIYAINEAPPQ